MSDAYPLVPLGEILRESKEWITLQPETRYRQVTVRLWGKGVALRAELLGAEIAAPKQVVVNTDQFILSRIDARNGAFGLIPAELDGAVVSNDFPVYTPDPSRALPAYLGWLSRTQRFVEICRLASEGTTNRKRLQEDRFLTMCIPLPAVEEQRRIVGRIEEVAGKLEAMHKLQTDVETELATMLRSAFNRIIAGAPHIALGDVAPLVRRPVDIEPGCTYAELGVRSFGRGLFDKPILTGSDLTWQKLFRVEEGDLVFSNIKAWEGAFAVARQRHGEMVGSHRYLTCVADPARASADFIWFYLQSPAGLLQIQEASPGSADRNRTLSQKGLEAISIPLPSLDAQRWFAHLQQKADSVRAVQAAAKEDAGKLVPALLERVF